jgi:hypothetical protein
MRRDRVVAEALAEHMERDTEAVTGGGFVAIGPQEADDPIPAESPALTGQEGQQSEAMALDGTSVGRDTGVIDQQWPAQQLEPRQGNSPVEGIDRKERRVDGPWPYIGTN